MSNTDPTDRVTLLQALWTRGPSFVTESYLGEATPDLLKSAGVEIVVRGGHSLDEDVALLFGAR